MLLTRRLRTDKARQAHLTFAATVAGTLAMLLLLRRFPPGATQWYPPCPIHALTGLLCPGCGSTRALAALARGHLSEAWADNPLLLLLLPMAVVAGLAAYYRAITSDRDAFLPVPPPAIAALVASALVFAIARNLARV